MSRSAWGLDDQGSFPVLDETAECNTFVFFFNLLMMIEKKLLLNFSASEP